MSETFCALPFHHLSFGAGGTARMCCMANDAVTEHGAPMSLSVHTLDEIWNSAYMRSARRGMLKGERISACQVCYQSEAVSGHSYRTLVGLRPLGPLVEQSELAKELGPGYRINKQPDFYKIELGNLCNIKCRMCYSSNSSEIERDPVHSKWNDYRDPPHAIWSGEVARIGPEPRIGVRTSGFYPPEGINGTLCRWTDGHGILNLRLRSGTRLKSLEITLHPDGPFGQEFNFIVNGRSMARGRLRDASAPIRIDLASFGDLTELTVELVSSRIVPAAGERERGIPVSELMLHREASGSRPEILSPRGLDVPWYMDDHVMFQELLKPAEGVRRLNITGGETLISKRLFEILDYLIDAGASKHVHLELPTNCTHVDDQIIERLRSFEGLQLVLSIDGIGKTYEYIRYPAKWDVVDANVRRLVQEFGTRCLIAPTIQIYNIFNLPELYRYADSLGIELVENILADPRRLAISSLPPKTRKVIAARLAEYCEKESAVEKKEKRSAVPRYLDELTSIADAELIKEFMQFTNDLDATRGQNFRSVNPELGDMLADDGFGWSNEIVYAKGDVKRRPSRERLLAWV